MAKIQVIKTLSDLTDQEIPEGDSDTVQFSLDGKDYEIDLTTEEAGELREKLAVYVAHGRRVTGAPQRTTGGRKATPRSTEVAEARAWLRENGYEVKDKGRISADLMDAYRLGKDVERGVTLETREDATVAVEPQAIESAPEEITGDTGPTDQTVIAWHQAKGYKLSLTKDGAPNGLMRARYLKATG